MRAWFAVAASLVATEASAYYWSAFEAKECRLLGARGYSAQIMDVPLGTSWNDACYATPATINGFYFATPARCINMGVGMWGEWDVPDGNCYPRWNTFQADACSYMGSRQYSAQLLDVPSQVSWEDACRATGANINGFDLAAPARCVNLGVGEWGEFEVPDGTCFPYWGSFSSNACSGFGLRQYSAQLMEIPSRESWDAACWSMGATIEGVKFDQPTRCKNMVVGEWGEFDLPDASCFPRWGDFKADDCTEAGRRQWSAQLLDIAGSWEDACARMPANLGGRSFAHPARCWNMIIGEWGEFDVDDPTCRAVTECTDPEPPAGATLKPGNSGAVSCDAWCANRDADWGAYGRCVKARIDGGPNAGQCLRCTDVGADFLAEGVSCWCAPPLSGFADIHNHQFANLGFGGLAMHGQAFGPIETALPPCNDVHGWNGLTDAIGQLLAIFIYKNGGLGHLNGGNPAFDGWPRWNSTTHQGVYEDWLYRAYAGGLRLMVVFAVNNQDIFVNDYGISATLAPGRTPGDMEAVRLQLAAAHEMQRHVDLEDDGQENGSGWYQIVTTPEDARRVIREGRLAVVLGVEVDYLFDCRSEAECDEAKIVAGLDELYALGVRHMYAVHFKENAFGAAALFNDLTQGVSQPCLPPYTYARCAVNGLTARGRFLFGELMKRGMIFDVDHLSRRAFDDLMELVEPAGYPVISSHAGYIDVDMSPDKLHEGNLDAAQVERIRNLGGMLSVIVQQGDLDEIQTWSDASQPRLTHTCGNTSQSWVQPYLYAVKQMNGAPVAVGTDFNGMAGLPGPRFGSEGCKGGVSGAAPKVPVDYPLSVAVAGPVTRLDRSVVGQRTFDVNFDGLAHMGLLPDLFDDMKKQGLRPEDLEPLYRSAEGYVDVWEKAVAAATPDPPEPPVDPDPQGDPAPEAPAGCGCAGGGAGGLLPLGVPFLLPWAGRRRRA